jgi:hypothetical protein
MFVLSRRFRLEVQKFELLLDLGLVLLDGTKCVRAYCGAVTIVMDISLSWHGDGDMQVAPRAAGMHGRWCRKAIYTRVPIVRKRYKKTRLARPPPPS